MAASQSNHLELVVFNFIRNHYEQKYKNNVPMALKCLMIRFSKKIIGCKLLTIKEDMQFVKLLLTKLPSIRRFNSLFKASDHTYSAAKFHDYCDNKGRTISIIESNWGNIFGGYTSKSWKPPNKDGAYVKDENAFLFLIKSDDVSIQSKCPLLLELKKNKAKYGIYCDPGYGAVFGRNDIFIHDNCNRGMDEKSCVSDQNYTAQISYHNDDIGKVNLCGGNRKDSIHPDAHLFQVIDYEVFQVK